MNDAEKKPELQGKLREFLVMRNLYEAAARQLTLKFEILNDEFSVLYARNPIHHIESRVKSAESIAAKLAKRGLPLTIETAQENLNDIAGVRVICNYIDDVYRVAEMFERQKDVEIVKRQDYIQTPNYNGYRSLQGTYPFLFGGVFRAKPVQLSHWWSYTGITGMYFPMLAEANVNIDVPDSSIPATAAHELAHTRGFAREDECNFLAYLTCIHSDSADFRYSGYLMAYIYCSNALYAYDIELWRETRAACSEGVLRDLGERNRYWEAFEGRVQEISNSVNNSFLESQGQEKGTLSYDEVVSLIVSYYIRQGMV